MNKSNLQTVESIQTELTSDIVCSVRNLTVTYRVKNHDYPALEKVNLDIQQGKITAIIGESGSGKSTLGYTMLNGIPQSGRVANGSVRYEGIGDILQMEGDILRKVRGRKVGMVFQATQNTLNPLKRVGSQVLDLAKSHRGRDGRTMLRAAANLAKRMSLDPDRVLTAYQHQLSGGMRQRVNLIFALLLDPEILILDEPTTALDVLSQSAVLKIIRAIQQERQLSIILITHDIGVVAEIANRVAVMYAGHLVEEGDVLDILRAPHHPYTQGLIRAVPRLTGDIDSAEPIAGAPPQLTTIPNRGCVFRERCPYRLDVCDVEAPPSRVSSDGTRRYECHLEGMAQ